MAEGGRQQRKPDFKTAVEDVKAIATVLAMEAEAILGRRTARVLGILVLFAVVVGVLLALLNWYVAPTKPSEKKDLVLALAQILAGTALLSGLYFTWRNLQVNREGQITERFTRAIDQLGKVDEGQKLFEIRIGGIYALERIAKESEEDYWPIMEILTAYVRQNARLPREEGQERTHDAPDEQRAMEGSGGKSESTEPSYPDPDIQAIMTILRRRSRSFGHGESEPLNLSGTNLSRADFRGAKLSEARFRGANLSGARFHGANLSRARLTEEANLEGAKLEGANLERAHLKGANLEWANLEGANVKGAHLEETNLTQRQLEETTGDKDTRLPSNLKPPAHWGVNTEEQPKED